MTSSNPLVSVVMPCYNARATLPMALASLLCQSYEDWECILIDDGSTDRPHEIVEQANDPRVRFERLPRNVGRGTARQVALERAAGDLLCGLDADDWFFPKKLARQVDAITGDTSLVAVATGMSIINAENEIVGVRGCGPNTPRVSVFGPFDRLILPIATAPSMVRMEAARRARYDQTLRTTEDMDFFLQFLPGRHFGWLPDVTYVYTEQQSVTREKILLSLHNTRRVVRKHRERHPVLSRVEVGRAAAKEAVYRTAYALGLGPRLVARRASPPGPADTAAFHAARRAVERVRDRVFAGV